jgi:hypothetical protein
VFTGPERSYNHCINLVIARYVPSLREAAARAFSLGDEPKLKSLLHGAEFRDVEITTETHRFVLPSFDIYFEPFERGGASTGQALVSLPEETRRAVREQVRRDLRDTGGAIEIEVKYRFGSGRRQNSHSCRGHPRGRFLFEAVTTNDSCGNVSLLPVSIEGSMREAASAEIDIIRRSPSAASFSFKSAAIGVAVS